MSLTAKMSIKSIVPAPKPTKVGLFYLLLATSSALVVFVGLYGHLVESSPTNHLQTDRFRQQQQQQQRQQQQQTSIRRLESGPDESEGDESIGMADSDHFLAPSRGRQSDNSAQGDNENSASEDDENFILGGGNSQLVGDEDTSYGSEPHGLGSNIANAKISVAPNDMDTAAGHHHHHKHYVHGWLEMGAHTGKKGAFGWHDKHPVGGKGRR